MSATGKRSDIGAWLHQLWQQHGQDNVDSRAYDEEHDAKNAPAAYARLLFPWHHQFEDQRQNESAREDRADSVFDRHLVSPGSVQLPI